MLRTRGASDSPNPRVASARSGFTSNHSVKNICSLHRRRSSSSAPLRHIQATRVTLWRYRWWGGCEEKRAPSSSSSSSSFSCCAASIGGWRSQGRPLPLHPWLPAPAAHKTDTQWGEQHGRHGQAPQRTRQLGWVYVLHFNISRTHDTHPPPLYFPLLHPAPRGRSQVHVPPHSLPSMARLLSLRFRTTTALCCFVSITPPHPAKSGVIVRGWKLQREDIYQDRCPNVGQWWTETNWQ